MHLPKVKFAMVGISAPGPNLLEVKRVGELKTNHELFQIFGLFLNGNKEMVNQVVTKGPDINQPSRHIVICLLEPDPSKSIWNNKYGSAARTISTIADRFSPEWSIHAITNVDKALDALERTKSDVQIVDYRNAPYSTDFVKFRSEFVPQSVNDIEFEKFCFLRWIIISEYFNYLKMHGVSVEFVLYLDADLFIFGDPFKIDLHSVDWQTMEAYRIVDGGAILWSLPGLLSYKDFIMDIILAKDKYVEMVTTYGTKVTCQEDRSLLIPCFSEGDSQKMFHFSDIIMFNRWADFNIELRHRKMEFNCVILHILHEGEEYHFIHDGSAVKLMTSPSETSPPVCFVHFQGNATKKYLTPFCSFFTGETSEYQFKVE